MLFKGAFVWVVERASLGHGGAEGVRREEQRLPAPGAAAGVGVGVVALEAGLVAGLVVVCLHGLASPLQYPTQLLRHVNA